MRRRTRLTHCPIAACAAWLLLAACAAPASELPPATGEDAASSEAIVSTLPVPEAATPGAGNGSLEDELATRRAALAERLTAMRARMNELGQNPAPEDMQGMLDEMGAAMDDMQGMMSMMQGMAAQGMGQAHMSQMQQMMGDMESMSEHMRGMMGVGGMDAMMSGDRSMQQMMEMMQAMHGELDASMPGNPDHHPTPTPEP